MKSMIKAMIAFFSVLLVALVVVLTVVLVRGTGGLPLFGRSGSWSGEDRLINTQTLASTDISQIFIKTYSSDIIFLPSESEDIVIKEYTSDRSIKDSFVNANRDGKTLSIMCQRKRSNNWFTIGYNYRYFEVYLPDSYHGAMKIDTSSGDINTALDLMLTEYSLNASSGCLIMNGLTADTISINTSSGDVHADTMNGSKNITTSSGCVSITSMSGDAKVTASSGDIMFLHAQGELDATTQSGLVKVSDFSGSAKIKTSSGDVFLEFTALTGPLTANTSSGVVSCRLPAEAGFQFQANTSSGDIVTNFDEQLSFDRKAKQAKGSVAGTTDFDMRVTTSSGDIFMDRR